MALFPEGNTQNNCTGWTSCHWFELWCQTLASGSHLKYTEWRYARQFLAGSLIPLKRGWWFLAGQHRHLCCFFKVAIYDIFSVVSGPTNTQFFHSFRHGEVFSLYPALQALMGSFIGKRLSSLLTACSKTCWRPVESLTMHRNLSTHGLQCLRPFLSSLKLEAKGWMLYIIFKIKNGQCYL